ncbi:hypothetical protein Q8O96_30945 [Pseudomonas sp. LPH60]|uniref:hypothetical protein n=1 Tax=Pseudomonas sp. LPH60 TaxID=3065906 RepID=UPI00273BF666|nr:hypothetical protein [Pseudomonas sp. LPH60]MDP4573491.1 hypothetical protein [Pseudomonas sp. LPH60]
MAKSILNRIYTAQVTVTNAVTDFITYGRSKAASEQASARMKKLELEASVRAEIVLRVEFEKWLDAEVMRLQLECVTDLSNKSRVDVLRVVTQARNDNAVCINALHHGDMASSVLGTDAVLNQWDLLRFLVS